MASTITEFGHLQIPLEDVVQATNNFGDEKIIGKGGFGNVYKGKLMHHKKLIDIAARRLDRKNEQEGVVEFWTEISMLSDLCNNRRIVTMIGFCDEKDEKIIIYRYYAKGSLSEHLRDRDFTWRERLGTSVGIVKAIHDLHYPEGGSYYVIHRNINSSTFLLDDDWAPNLSGFEFSIKHSVDRRNQVLLCEAIGTKGYMDPAILKSGGVTEMSDVYSMGVVLFEILCGRKAYEDNKLLAPLAKFHYENGTLQDIIHPGLNMGRKSVKCFSKVAYSCLEEERARRPSLVQVQNKLQEAFTSQLWSEVDRNYDDDEDEDEDEDENDDDDENDVLLKEKELENADENTSYKEWKDVLKDTFNRWQLSRQTPREALAIQNGTLIPNNKRQCMGAVIQSIFSVLHKFSNEMISNVKKPGEDVLTDKDVVSNLWKLSSETPTSTREAFTIQEGTLISNNKRHCMGAVVQSTFSVLQKFSNKMIIGMKTDKLKKWEHLRIGLRDIQLATDNFSKKYRINSRISFKRAYKAKLHCFDREYISSLEEKNIDELPKRLYSVKIELNKNREDDEFKKKIKILSSCKHRNIESLLGFCDEGPDMILVYEYVETQYLFHHLQDRILTWEKRLKICIDVAHGLSYLNSKMALHGFIDTYKIVLDCNWGAKIVDFDDFDCRRQPSIELCNGPYPNKTLNCLELNIKPDVYDFGEVMFQILTGVSRIDLMISLPEGEGLGHMARGWDREGILKKKITPILKEENDDSKLFLHKGPNKDSLDTFIKILFMCLSENPSRRPTMGMVVRILCKALSFQVNKDPFRMSFEDIKLATQDFSPRNVIGGGGFGKVYKGELAHHHTVVAKRLDTSLGQGEQQYNNELQILYEYKHENVIGLVGYSNETDEKIIVYEHACKGSLDKYLNDASLTWRNRLMICIDFATGLDFLHGGVHGKEVVIHRDIKAANILLFDDWKAKIGDFGLSMISTVNKEADYVIDHACGTKGYLDPLYLKSGFLTIESDIYSFGVVLFEILCGRSTFEIRKHEGQFLPGFIKHKFEEGKQDEMVFESIKEEIMPKSLTTFQEIAYLCLDDDREKRPMAKEILAQLKKALEFQEDKSIRAQTS